MSDVNRMLGTEGELRRRLNELERRVEWLYEHLNLGQAQGGTVEAEARETVRESGPSATVSELIESGQILRAIKVYREETGCDLVTAKRVVERYESELNSE